MDFPKLRVISVFAPIVFLVLPFAALAGEGPQAPPVLTTNPVGKVIDIINAMFPENLHGNSINPNGQDDLATPTRNTLKIRGNASYVRHSAYGARTNMADALENTVQVMGQSVIGTVGAAGGNGGSIYGGYVNGSGKNAIGNKAYVEDSVRVLAGNGPYNGSVFGGFSDRAGRVERNEVTIKGSAQIDNSVYGGFSTGGGDVLDNTVFLNQSTSLRIEGWVYGGYASSAGNVTGNTVYLKGSTGAAKGIYGGYGSNSGNVENNQVFLDGFQQVVEDYDGIYGGVSYNGGDVLNNKVIFREASQAPHVYGGYSMGDQAGGNVRGNHVDFLGWGAKGVYGGYIEGSGTVDGNSVTVTAGDAEAVYGGYSRDTLSIVSNNTVTVDGLYSENHVDGRYIGGYMAGTSYGPGPGSLFGRVENNTVTVNTDALFGQVYGGYSDGNALVSGNTVNYSATGTGADTATLRLYGGYSRFGNATGNRVNVNGGGTNVMDIYGGYSDGLANATDNQVSISSGKHIVGNIYGGYAGDKGITGSANANSVTVDSSRITGDIYGGYITGGSDEERRDANNNVIRLNSSTVEGYVYGGLSGHGHSTGNTVYVTGEGSYSGIFGGHNQVDGYTEKYLSLPPVLRAPGGPFDRDCFAGNTLYKGSEDSRIGVVASFERIVFEYSGKANIGTLSITPYYFDRPEYISDNYPRVILDTQGNDIDLTGTKIHIGDSFLRNGLGTMIKEGSGKLTTTSLDWAHLHIKEGTWQNNLPNIHSDPLPYTQFSAHIYDGAKFQLHTVDDQVDFLGLITGPGSLTKTGAGILSLWGSKEYSPDYEWGPGDLPFYPTDDHTFTGDLAVEQGILRIADGSTLFATGSRASTVNVNLGAGLAIGRSTAGPRSLAADAANFSSDSIFLIDLGGSGHVGQLKAASVNITQGAKFALMGSHAIAVGETLNHTFMEATSGIAGEFDPITVNPSLLTLSTVKNGNSYEFTATRISTLENALGSHGDRNTRSLTSGLDSLYGSSNPHAGILHDILGNFDTMATREEMLAYARQIVDELVPETTTQALNAIQNHNTAAYSMMRNVFTNYDSNAASLAAQGIRSTDAFASVGDPDNRERLFYTAPLGQWTRFSAPSAATYNEFTAGAGLGFGLRQKNSFAIGVNAYFLRSDLSGDYADLDTNTYGLNLYGRKYLAAADGPMWFAEGGLGYAYGDTKQVRYSPWGNNNSKLHSHLFSANLGTGVDIPLSARAVLTPTLGFDYNFINTGAYSENGTNTRLHVNPDDYNSFQAVLGIQAKTNLTDCVFVTGRAAYRYEFADRSVTTRNTFAVASRAQFTTYGFEQERSRGELGAGIGWEPTERITLGLNYDFQLMERQTSHSVMGSLGIKF